DGTIIQPDTAAKKCSAIEVASTASKPCSEQPGFVALDMHRLFSRQNCSGVINDEIEAIRADLCGAFRPEKSDGPQPLIQLLSKPARPCILACPDLLDQSKISENRNRFFAARREATIGQPYE